jgi:lipid A oxidase
MNSGRVFRNHVLSVSCVYLVSLQPARAEWAAAAYFGGARTAQTALRVQAQGTDLRIHPISYRANSFQSPIYYGYRAGYFFTRHFGVEGEFTHLKVYADTARNAQFSGSLRGSPFNGMARLDSVVQRFNITHGANLLVANFVARKGLGHDLESPRFTLLARVGGGLTIPHAENEILGISNDERYQIGSPAFHLAAGTEIRLWRRLSADTEVKYTRTRENVDTAQGAAESLLNSVHGIIGFVWHF